MDVLIDTNVLYSDFRMEGPEFQMFLNHRHVVPFDLFVPEVVIDECVNKYRETVEETISTISDCNRQLKKLELDRYPDIDTSDKLTLAYRRDLERIIRLHGRIIPYPRTSHKDLVTRDLARKRPFKKSGIGYRDALIWESLRSRLWEGTEELVFVTNNTSDFGEGPDLHEELSSDIRNPRRVRIVRSIKSLNDVWIRPKVAMIDKVHADALLKPEFPLLAWLRDSIAEVLNDYSDILNNCISGFPDNAGRTRASEVLEYMDVSVQSANHLDTQSKLVDLSLHVRMRFSISVDWEDYQRSHEVREAMGYNSEYFSHASWYDVQSISFRMLLVLRESPEAIVDSYELASLSGDHGSYEL
jgi:hypothetical protein